MQEKETISIVWLKRDLRLRDHAPLANAIEAGHPVLLCYIFEPSMSAEPDWDIRHWRFVRQSLEDMQSLLSIRNLSLYYFHHEVIDTFLLLAQNFNIHTVFAHQETGNWASFMRDIAVAKHLKAANIPFLEYQYGGVIRRLKDRKNWDKHYAEVLETPIIELPKGKLQTPTLSESLYHQLCPKPWPKAFFEDNPKMQRGGESLAHKVLQNFLARQAKGYMKHISKPSSSRQHCSRLSPYIAWGNLSVRQVYQATYRAIGEANYKNDLENFISRVFWQSHFIQKLESQPTYQFQSVNIAFAKAYDGNENTELLNAWKEARTGFPLVDATMRAIIATGWLNFRMRAMLVSFLTHHLGQPWQTGTAHLAQQFLDYEPGIHYSQFQMQAGVTGINLIRTYNPVKQSQEHDPDGIFIKEWMPELRDIPVPLLHEPWQMNELEQVFYHCQLGKDYPLPIAPPNQNKVIVQKLWDIKKSEEARRESQNVLKKYTQRNDTNDNKVLRIPKRDKP